MRSRFVGATVGVREFVGKALPAQAWREHSEMCYGQ